MYANSHNVRLICFNLQKNIEEMKTNMNIKDIAEENNDDNNNLEIEKNDINMQKLYEINSDIIGWIRIDNSNIDYPVMQTKKMIIEL